jgi:hypothetical protein
MVAMSIFFVGIIASKTHLASSPPAASASVSARGVICQEAPAFLAVSVDDGVPVAVRLFLSVRRNPERKRLVVLEVRAAVETETGNAHDGELHH